MNKTRALPFLLIPLLALPAFATAPSGFSYEGRVLDATGAPSTDSVSFQVQILSPDDSCVLFTENEPVVNLGTTDGYFSLSIGSASTASATALRTVFNNSSTSIAGTGGCSYTPAVSDGRMLRITVINSTTSTQTTMSPDLAIGAAPLAMEAEMIAGLGPNSLLRVDATAALANTSPLSNSQYTSLLALINGTSSLYMTAGNSGAALPSVATAPSGASAGAIWYNSTTKQIQFYNGSGTQTLGTGGGGSGTVTSVAAGAGLSGGTITSSGTISLPTVGTSGSYYKVSTDAYGRVTGGSSALGMADVPSVSGSAISSGTIGGSTAINTTGAITTSGNISSQNLSASGGSFNTVILNDSESTPKTLTFQAPATLTSSYTLKWPAALGGTNQVLTTDSTGNLTWTTPGGSGINALTGDVTASGTGSVSSVVSKVNGVTYGSSPSINSVPVVTASNVVAYEAVPNAALANSSVTVGTTNIALGGTTNTISGLNSMSLGTNGTTTGLVSLAASVGGGASVTLANGGTTTAYNFNLPTTAGTAGYALISGGGGSSPMTWAALPSSTGSAAISTVGTVTTGTWNGSPIGIAYGGTGSANGSITGTGALTFAAGGTNQGVTLTPSGSGIVTVSGGMTVSGVAGFSAGQSITGQSTQTYTGTTGPANSIAANALTSGSILSLGSTSTAASTGNTGLNIAVSGANSNSGITRYGMQSSVIATGTTSTNVAGYFSASGGTNNYGLLVPNGNVGIGTSAPATTLDLNGAETMRAMSSPGISNAGQGRIYFDSSSLMFQVSQNGGAYAPLVTSASAANFVSATVGAGTAAAPTLNFSGDPTTGFFDAGSHTVAVAINGSETMAFTSSGITGTGPLVVNAGGTNQSLTLVGSGTGSVNIGSGNGEGLSVIDAGTTADYVTVKGAPAGGGPTIGTAGSDTNINLLLAPKGTGRVGIGTTSPAGFLDVEGTGGVILNAGNVGVGTSTAAYPLTIVGDVSIASANVLRFGATAVCTSTGCTSSSDRRLKENIKPLQGSLEKVMKLQGVEYDYKDKKQFTDQHQIGVIAQDTESVFPEAVTTDKQTGLKAVAYDHLVAPLIEAVKSLYLKITHVEVRQTATERELVELKAENAGLKARLDRLEKSISGK